MTVLIALLVALVVALIILALVAGRLSEQAGADLVLRFAREEHGRLMASTEAQRQLLETFGYRITDASLRESEDTRILLRSLTSDRHDLIAALLSAGADPRAAQRFGLVTQPRPGAAVDEPPTDARAFLDQIMDEQRRTPGSELTDEYGDPIVPVGMGSG